MELPGVPARLRGLVVQQDYAQYTEVDQAVWRFVVLQAYRRLCQTAHPAYRQGFAAAGIEVDRIPRMEQMSERQRSRIRLLQGSVTYADSRLAGYDAIMENPAGRIGELTEATLRDLPQVDAAARATSGESDEDVLSDVEDLLEN